MTTAAGEAGEALARLVEVVDRLLADEGGCAWNRAQDHRSLVTYLVEETSELVEALEDGTASDVREELGDVLYQVVLHAAVAARAPGAGGSGGATTLSAVVDDVRDKTVRRHPHVFAEATAESLDDIVDVWSAAKAVEKASRESAYDGVARTMPALARAQKLAARRRSARGTSAVDEVRADAEATAVGAAADHPTGRLAEARDEAEWGRLLLAEVDAVEARGFDVERALRTAVREREERLRAEERAAARER